LQNPDNLLILGGPVFGHFTAKSLKLLLFVWSCEPHQQAEHMAAPTNVAFVKKVLANSEPSTHGPKRTFHDCALMSAFGGKADIEI
jgi:hypothetical protein